MCVKPIKALRKWDFYQGQNVFYHSGTSGHDVSSPKKEEIRGKDGADRKIHRYRISPAE